MPKKKKSVSKTLSIQNCREKKNCSVLLCQIQMKLLIFSMVKRYHANIVLIKNKKTHKKKSYKKLKREISGH